MKTSVVLADQARDFILSRAPEPRRVLRRGIRGLAEDKGDTKPLHSELAGYARLRVTHYRVIYEEKMIEGERVIECVCVAERNVVYQLFAQMLRAQLGAVD